MPAIDEYNKRERFEDCKKKLNRWIEDLDLGEDEHDQEVQFTTEEFEYPDGHDGIDLMINLSIGLGPISLYHEAFVDEPNKKGPEIIRYVKNILEEEADNLFKISDSIKI